MTPAALEAFQKTHLSHLGRPLKADGVLGPQSEWALDFDTLSTGRRSIVRVAQAGGHHPGLAAQCRGATGRSVVRGVCQPLPWHGQDR